MTTPLQQWSIARKGRTIRYIVIPAPEYADDCQEGETPIRVLAPSIMLDHLWLLEDLQDFIDNALPYLAEQFFGSETQDELKRTPISIRVFEQDIPKLKLIAKEEWMPYQTLITSLLHKFANKKIITSLE